MFVISAVENKWISAVSIKMMNKSTNEDTERTDKDCRVENLKHLSLCNIKKLNKSMCLLLVQLT